MVNKTPLRLVAIEESLSADDDQDASPQGMPVRIISDHEAITRKVEAAAMITAHDTPPDQPGRRANRRHLLPAAGALAVLVAVLIGVLGRDKVSRKASLPLSPSATIPLAAPEPPPRTVPAIVPVPAPPAKRPVETIRLQIIAEPARAELSLDGNSLADHRLNLEVPKDRGIHVVSASAPGYLPFNQQVSFSSDVVLTISLRRSRSPVAVRPTSRLQKTAVETKATGGPPATVQSARSIEPGMNLENPPMRGNAKAIDERNPYSP